MLEIRNLSKTFYKGTVNEKTAIHDVSITFETGDYVTVIGGNGAGKSTLLNLIAGVFPADTGEILLDGTDLTRLPEHRRASMLGRVFQDPMMGTAAGMGIEENLAMAHRRGQRRGLGWGISAAEREQYREALRALDLGLEGRLSTKVGLLSAVRGSSAAEKVLRLSDQLIEEHHLTAMMVTHNMRDAIAHGNRLIMMHEGTIILDISGEQKSRLTVEDLLARFTAAAGGEFANDRALLT